MTLPMESSTHFRRADSEASPLHSLKYDSSTVLPTKSDSNDKFCFKVIRDLESINHLCINPIRRIELIHK